MAQSQINAVAYVRVSSPDHEKNEDVIASQRKLIDDYATRNGLKIAKQVVDSGKFTELELGPNFVEMMKATDPNFDRIIISSFDRVTRSPKVLQAVMHLLNNNNCKLVSVTESHSS